MSEMITVILRPERDQVRLLATTPSRDRMKAVLGPPGQAHPKAAATLLEGLSLWHQQPLSVVLSADDMDSGYALGLYDALGFGRTLHYEVGVVYEDRRARRRRSNVCSLGDFRDLRQLGLWVPR